MEDAIERTGQVTVVPPYILLSSDEDNTNSDEESGTEDLCKILHSQHYESSKTDIVTDVSECQTQDKCCSLTLQSWASEMSLLDKLTPRKSMRGIKYPATPAVVPTPSEFKEINWKKLAIGTSNSVVLPSPKADKNSGCIEELVTELEDDSGEREEGEGASISNSNSNSNLCASVDGSVETPERFAFSEGEPSACSKTSSQRSDQECNTTCWEPVFDQQNLIVNYLPPDMDSTMLHKLFSPYGTIISCKVVVDHASGLSKGYGFVKFQTAEEGCRAQTALHQYQAGRKTLKVSFSRRPQSGERTKHHTNLYLSNLDPQTEQADLERNFKRCGYVVQCKVLKNAHGVSKRIGFVRFDNADSAKRAIERFDGEKLDGTNRPIKIRIASTPRAPPGRESVPRNTFNTTFSALNTPVYPTSSACYVAGFHVSLSEKALKKFFAPKSGRKVVKSVRIIRRQNGPYAFVNFFNCEDAAEAANILNDTNLGDHTLTVRLKT